MMRKEFLDSNSKLINVEGKPFIVELARGIKAKRGKENKNRLVLNNIDSLSKPWNHSFTTQFISVIVIYFTI